MTSTRSKSRRKEKKAAWDKKREAPVQMAARRTMLSVKRVQAWMKRKSCIFEN